MENSNSRTDNHNYNQATYCSNFGCRYATCIGGFTVSLCHSVDLTAMSEPETLGDIALEPDVCVTRAAMHAVDVEDVEDVEDAQLEPEPHVLHRSLKRLRQDHPPVFVGKARRRNFRNKWTRLRLRSGAHRPFGGEASRMSKEDQLRSLFEWPKEYLAALDAAGYGEAMRNTFKQGIDLSTDYSGAGAYTLNK